MNRRFARIQGARRLFAAIGLLSPVLCLLVSPGCAVASAAAPTVTPEPGNPPSATVPAPPPPVRVPLPAVSPEAPMPPDELIIFVESTPPGATIVMDGRPMGKAPLRLSIPATSLGFFRDYVELRARFIAADETEVSRTATEEFTPREKIPALLQFTPDGAQRTVR